MNSDFTIDAAVAGGFNVTYSGPGNAPSGGGTPTYTTGVTFAGGQSTTALATTLVDAQTVTITAASIAQAWRRAWPAPA